MSDRIEEEIREAVRREMVEAALDVESITFAEVYDFDDDDIKRAHHWQCRAKVEVTFDE